MKSNATNLASRGYVQYNNGSEKLHIYSLSEKLNLLKSTIATERTIGARLLGADKEIESIPNLIHALKNEQKIYCKIELSNTLALFGKYAIPALINVLGVIGNNQLKAISEKSFNKDCYPLPRDIAGRILIRIGIEALPKLAQLLKTKDYNKLSEATDTIGHINFYSKQNYAYNSLLKCYSENINHDVIRWKIIRAFSGYTESIKTLTDFLLTEKNILIKNEIERSMRILNKRINHE